MGLVVASCSDPLGVESDVLVARIVNERLQLINPTRAPVYYFAADRDILAVLEWVICIDPNRCDAVPPESTKSVALEDVIGGGESGKVVVYHWRLIPGQSTTGYVADSLRAVTVAVH